MKWILLLSNSSSSQPSHHQQADKQKTKFLCLLQGCTSNELQDGGCRMEYQEYGLCLDAAVTKLNILIFSWFQY